VGEGSRRSTHNLHPRVLIIRHTQPRELERTDNNIRFAPEEARVNEDSSDFSEIFLTFSYNGVQVVRPLQPDLFPNLWSENGLVSTSLSDCQRKQILEEDKFVRREICERHA